MTHLQKKQVTFGVDIGGTNTVFGVVAPEGEILAEGHIPTLGHEPAENLITRLHEAMESIFQPLRRDHELIGIGIGAPNANYYRGTVELPPNLNWKIVNLVALVKKYYDLPVALTNDANAAAIGEKIFGAAKDMAHFMVITLGTGLGSGIVVNNELVYGHDGFAGELGHSVVDPEGRRCGCGKRGCLETYASATGICRTMSILLAENTQPSHLRSIPPKDLTACHISEAANNGDFLAIQAFERTGRILGMKLADAVTVTSPEAIFLFGGLMNSGSLILEPTRRYLELFLPPVFRNKIKLLPSGLQDKNIAVLGSSALILRDLDKKEKK